ncbi:putative chlorophyll A-B binding protein [Helianthus anomalus]
MACASSAIAAVAFSSPSSQKSVGSTKASFLGGKKLRVSKVGAPSGSRSFGTVCVAADPDRPIWFPGSTPPEWLDGSLPGDFGFDPLGLGKHSVSIHKFYQHK